MDTNAVVKQLIGEYAQDGGANLALYPLTNDEKQVYGVVMIDTPIHKEEASLTVLARVVGETVIIEEDTTDTPLWQALLEKGIPRQQIICAYAGESLP